MKLGRTEKIRKKIREKWKKEKWKNKRKNQASLKDRKERRNEKVLKGKDIWHRRKSKKENEGEEEEKKI